MSFVSELLKEWNKVRKKYPNFIKWLDEIWKMKTFPKPF